jgi:Ni,Fe-hydrogenase III large subunit
MPEKPLLAEVVARGRPVDHRPWPRVVVDEEGWRVAIAGVVAGAWTLAGLWGERDAVHMALLDEGMTTMAVVSLECRDRKFPSVGRLHAPAIRLERAIFDLYGLEPEGSPDPRPWLDHGRWGSRHPLGAVARPAAAPSAYAFLPTEGEGLHRIPVGPVHAGIIEPGHFRFTANGETVVRLEERLGYVHKGIEALMAGAPLERGARLAGHVSGDSTVAYAFAFARAVEAALEIEVPPRSLWLRALVAELERIANHFGDIGAICNDASFVLMHAHCGVLRERVLRALDTCFGHRLAMDCIVPGGMSVDLDGAGVSTLGRLVREARPQFVRLVELYDNTASLQNRTVGTGTLQPTLARQYGCGGYTGRASGRAFDARRVPGYAPYSSLQFDVPVSSNGDVDARVRIRIGEVQQSLGLIEQILERLPSGSVHLPVETKRLSGPREGMALVEGFRGDILAWVRISDPGTIMRCHLRDPSWFQWPLLEAAVEGNIVADFPLCNKSFNCSYSGHDL